MTPMSKREQALALLRLLLGPTGACSDAYVSTFYLKRTTREDWYAHYAATETGIEQAAEAALSQPYGVEAYVRLTLLNKVPDKRGTSADTACANVLWVDLDCEKAGVDSELALTELKIGRNGVPPVTLAVQSGGGIHAYWQLCEPIKNVEDIESRTRGIRNAFKDLGADKVQDAARVLRVPGTMNYKYDPPRDVVVLSYQGAKCYPADAFPIAQAEQSTTLHAGFQAVEVTAEFRRRLRGQSATPTPLWNMIQSAETASAELGIQPHEIDRSALGHHIACEMIRRKFTLHQVYTVLTHPEWYSGEKYRESGNDEKYVADTIRGAMDDIIEERRLKLESWLDDKGGPDTDAAVQSLRETYHFRSLGDGDRKILAYYDKELGIYVPEGQGRVLADLELKWKDKLAPEPSNKVLLRVKASAFGKENALGDPQEGFVCFANGMIDVRDEKLTLLPHDPKYRMVARIPRNWPTDKTMTEHDEAMVNDCLNFMRGIVGDDQMEGLLQSLGYVFWPSTPIKSIFFLYGPSNTGKSQIIRFLIHLIGEDNAYLIDPQELVDDGFAMWAVYRKMLICHEDIRADKVFSTMSPLKTLSDGMRVTANPKYLDRVSFTPTAKQWYATNFEPRSPQPDPAFIRRLQIFDCMRVFGDGDRQLDIGERFGRNSRLCSLLIPVLIRKAQEAVERGQFDVFGIRDKHRRVRYLGDPYYRFVMECTELVTEPQKASLTGQWWETWRMFARQFGHLEGSFQHFSQRLSEMASEGDQELRGLERWNATSESGKQQSCIKFRKLKPARDWGVMEFRVRTEDKAELE